MSSTPLPAPQRPPPSRLLAGNAAMHITHYAHRADLAPSDRVTKNEAPAVAAAQGFRDQTREDEVDFQASGFAKQAALVVEGEAYAAAYLERLQAGTAQPGELALIVEFLRGEMLHGACRAIEKALEGRHHA